ncbi:hypothetical protein GXW78_26880 [Roseomonas terrae]|uniref:Glycine-rich domain-containing protein n=1 Tax=Neoroseomonas terrae TaxID=424799 RepID=A0ABS5ERM6_9PROT|nr:hypothetical protein [Neoroseomonas terrae]MBR0653307.1 hypothetical protein [Neoroseomonas terrae]
MQLVTRSTAVPVMPQPPASPGSPGWFARPDPVGGVPATVPGYEWYNGIQGELYSFLVAAGITPDAANVAQVLEAACRLFAQGRMQAFTANGTFVVPAGVYRIRCRVWGGGGAGASSSSGNYPGGGGGSGGYGEGVYNVTPGSSITVTRGAGGVGGNGGSSSFGSLLTASGGQFGVPGSAGGVGAGGAGGAVSGAQISVPGANGSGGIYYGAAGGTVEGGNGGAAYGSSPVRGVGVAASSLNGNPGTYPGGGGSGGTGASGSGAGAAGLVVVEW